MSRSGSWSYAHSPPEVIRSPHELLHYTHCFTPSQTTIPITRCTDDTQLIALNSLLITLNTHSWLHWSHSYHGLPQGGTLEARTSGGILDVLSLRGAREALNWKEPAETKVSRTGPAETKESRTGPAETKESRTEPAGALGSRTEPAGALGSRTEPAGALERTLRAPGTERALERTLRAPGTERARERTLRAPGTERARERTLRAPGTERAWERTLQ